MVRLTFNSYIYNIYLKKYIANGNEDYDYRLDSFYCKIDKERHVYLSGMFTMMMQRKSNCKMKFID